MPSPAPVPSAEPDSTGVDADGPDSDIAHAFRPKKKRKIYRSRNLDVDSPTTAPAGPADNAAAGSAQCDDALIELTANPAADATMEDARAPDKDRNPLAHVRQQRRNLQHRKQGTVYDSHSAVRATTGPSSAAAGQAYVLAEEKDLERESKDREDERAHVSYLERFSVQRGHTGDGDRHMAAYIDAELDRRQTSHPTVHASNTHPASSSLPTQPASTATAHSVPLSTHSHLPARQPATLGRIQEVSIPSPSHTPTSPPKPKPKVKAPPVRLSRSGAPLPPRRRPRRGSADLARDALVEAVLSETRPMVDPGVVPEGEEEERMTDEMMAERFRREYLEREGHGGRREREGGKDKDKGKEEERLKGPKLGGSRMLRAQMRERELEAQREREKKRR